MHSALYTGVETQATFLQTAFSRWWLRGNGHNGYELNLNTYQTNTNHLSRVYVYSWLHRKQIWVVCHVWNHSHIIRKKIATEMKVKLEATQVHVYVIRHWLKNTLVNSTLLLRLKLKSLLNLRWLNANFQFCTPPLQRTNQCSILSFLQTNYCLVYEQKCYLTPKLYLLNSCQFKVISQKTTTANWVGVNKSRRSTESISTSKVNKKTIQFCFQYILLRKETQFWRFGGPVCIWGVTMIEQRDIF